MDRARFDAITPYLDVKKVLLSLSQGIHAALSDNLVGLYLIGSLTYGDFKPESSDIDLVAIVKTALSAQEIESVRKMHVEGDYNGWAKRIECSYTPLGMLTKVLPPKEPRPYFNDIFYPDATYGNEWIINLYLQYHYGIALLGPDFKTLIAPIDIVEVQKACIRDLFREWEPKITDPVWLSNSHYQSYIVLNLCRILYTVLNGTTGSKPASAAWVKSQFSESADLIKTAEDWRYGSEMNRLAETVEFIKFAIREVQATELYMQVV